MKVQLSNNIQLNHFFYCFYCNDHMPKSRWTNSKNSKALASFSAVLWPSSPISLHVSAPMKKRRKSTHKRSERAEKLQQCHKANVRGDREEKFSRLIHKLLSCRIVWTRFHRTIVSSKEWNFMLLVYRAKSEVRIRQSGNIFVMLNLTRECWTRISNIRKEKEKKERAIKKCRNKNEWKESIGNISWRILCELRKPDRRRAAEIIKKKLWNFNRIHWMFSTISMLSHRASHSSQVRSVLRCLAHSTAETCMKNFIEWREKKESSTTWYDDRKRIISSPLVLCFTVVVDFTFML